MNRESYKKLKDICDKRMIKCMTKHETQEKKKKQKLTYYFLETN